MTTYNEVNVSKQSV